MPDFSTFLRHFNTNFAAPTTNRPSLALLAEGNTISASEAATIARLADSTWRVLAAQEPAAKDANKANAAAAAASSNHNNNRNNNEGNGHHHHHPSIVVGRMTVSTEDRWRIQAQLRREEVKSGLGRREYNKKVTRAVKVTKGPMGDGFPAGRGRPV